MDDIHGVLTTYETRTCKEDFTSREVAIKFLRKNKVFNLEYEDINIKESNFVRNLKKGVRKV